MRPYDTQTRGGETRKQDDARGRLGYDIPAALLVRNCSASRHVRAGRCFPLCLQVMEGQGMPRPFGPAGGA